MRNLPLKRPAAPFDARDSAKARPTSSQPGPNLEVDGLEEVTAEEVAQLKSTRNTNGQWTEEQSYKICKWFLQANSQGDRSNLNTAPVLAQTIAERVSKEYNIGPDRNSDPAGFKKFSGVVLRHFKYMEKQAKGTLGARDACNVVIRVCHTRLC